jgi:ribonuclease J
MENSLKIIPLGGMGTVTKNMYLYEYDDEILIVDCGIGFPDPTMLGVDVLIPDTAYLQDKKDKIVGMVLTHAHDDHIGGLPYILPQLGTHYPIYGSKLTLAFAQDRLSEFDIPANFKELDDSPINIGHFIVDNVKITHSVPDARHLVIKTPASSVYHGSDFKLDFNPIDGVRPDLSKVAASGREGITLALIDSLNSEIKEFSRSESSLTPMFASEMRDIKGKVIVTVMSSNIHRIQQIVNVASRYDRQVAFVGRSIEQNVKTATKIGFLKLPGNVISRKKIKNHKDHQLCIIIAGSQGQIGSSLSRAAEGDHAQVQIKPSDKVIFASEPIPGNEQNVYAAIDSIARIGADLTYSDIVDNVHVSGHSSAIEQKLLLELIKPREIIPIGGTYHHMIQFRQNARELGYQDRNIHLLDNGQVLSVNRDKAWISQTLDLKNVMVDGLGIGDVGHIVLRDRQRMAEDGILIVVVPVEQQTGQVRGEIEIISRGFVYMKHSEKLIQEIKQNAIESLGNNTQVVIDWQTIRRKIEASVETQIYEITQRQPLILTVILEV